MRGQDGTTISMGRAYYRFGHDLALRLSNGQAIALRDAELGAYFGSDASPFCFLRGTFTTGTFRALIARGLIAPHPELQSLAQPVAVQLALRGEQAARVGKDAAALQHYGRRLDQNSLTDEIARNLLLFEQWQLVAAAPAVQGTLVQPTPSVAPTVDPAQEAAMTEMVTDIASELWAAAEEAGERAQSPIPEEAVSLEEAVRIFFEAEEWQYEAVGDVDGVLRASYDGQNGSWLCYTRILLGLDQVIFYSVCPIPLSEIAIPAMAEYLCRVNADLSLGNFEIDFGHNVVRFRTSVDVADVGLDPLLFRNLVFQNLAVMDIYLPELLEIMAGRKSPLPLT